MTIDENLRRAVEETVRAAITESASERAWYLASLVHLDAGEAAELIRTHRDEVYKLVNSGAIACTRFGKKIVIARTELDRFMSQQGHHAPQALTSSVRRRLAAP